MRIAVAGMGYVGLANAVLLSQRHEVWAVDILPERVEMINQRKSPIADKEIEQFFAERELNLYATVDGEKAYANADFVIIATPTNYDSEKNYFDTSSVEAVLELIHKVNSRVLITPMTGMHTFLIWKRKRDGIWRKRGTSRPILTSVIPSGGSGEKSNKKIVQHAEKKKIIFEKI